MEKDFITERKKHVLQVLSVIPKKILSLHGRDNIAEFVIHDLSQENCFDLKKAAYFVDNPDFNCLKGIAGIETPDIPKGLWKDVWANGEKFSTYMRNANFNKRVRDFAQCSLNGAGGCGKNSGPKFKEDDIITISKNLGIENPSFYTLDVKHGNSGLFIFEKGPLVQSLDKQLDSHLQDGVSLLGFCPIF